MLVSSTFVTQAAVSTVSLIAPDSTKTVSLVSAEGVAKAMQRSQGDIDQHNPARE
jgi:hypothetical protein